MAKRRRKRLRYYAGAGLALCLLLYLGGQDGWFGPGAKGLVGSETGGSSVPVAGDFQPPAGRQGAIHEKTKPVPGRATPSRDAKTAGPPDTKETSAPIVPPAGQALGVTKVTPAMRLDEALGMIRQLEDALGVENIAEVACLEEALRQQPLLVPADLLPRWTELQSRVKLALDCVPRLRTLLRGGHWLAARAMVRPLRAVRTPVWMRDRVDRAAQSLGWPALCRDYELVGSEGLVAAVLAKHREIRFVYGGRIQKGRVWGARGRRLTVRVSGTAGFTYPSLDRVDAAPMNPSNAEALAQGLAAAESKQVASVLLWCCHLREVGDKAGAAKLRALLK